MVKKQDIGRIKAMQSTTITTKNNQKQIEYHLYIYKGKRNKTFVWINTKSQLTKEELIRIANKYYKVRANELDVIYMYRLGENLYSTPVYRSVLTPVVCKK
jgi:hypothetical protein